MRKTLKNEDGASLVLVIAFVMIFALILGAIIEFAGTGFDTSRAIASERAEQMALDAAMDGAINAIRGSDSAGAGVGQPCAPTFEYDGDEAVFDYGSGVEHDPDVTVTCVTEQSSQSSLAATMPEYAVLTLSQDECEGFLLDGTTPHPENRLTIRGGIFSNGRIAVGNDDQNPACSGNQNGDPISVVGDVWAQGYGAGDDEGGCTPWDEAEEEPTQIGFTGEMDCRLSTTEADPGIGNSAYDPAVPDLTGMTIDPVVTCPGDVIVFPPGVYTEHPIEHVRRAGCDQNANSIWWFQPGVHYFDLPEASSLWDFSVLGGINVVGGTLAPGLSQSSPPSAFDFDDSDGDGIRTCITEDSNGDPVDAVQFIFGGYSRIETQSSQGGTKGDMELCGGLVEDVPGYSSAATQQIALYGLRADQDDRAETNDEFEPASVVDPGSDWSDADAAKLLDEGGATPFAEATLTGNSNEEASLEFSDFGIPEGSLISEVRVKARHAEPVNADEVVPELFITVGGGSPQEVGDLSTTATFESVAAFRDSVDDDEYPEISGSLSQVFMYDDVNDLTVTYKVSGKHPQFDQSCVGNGRNQVCTPDTAEVELEALVVDVTYTPPGFNAQECPASEPDCKFLTTTVNPRVIFRGTVYTPLASYRVSMQNGTDQLFNRGIIAWDLIVTLNASSNQTVSPFQLPGFEARRRVLFEAAVGTQTCAQNPDNCRLRVRVEYSDDQSTTGRDVEILDWSVIQ